MDKAVPEALDTPEQHAKPAATERAPSRPRKKKKARSRRKKDTGAVAEGGRAQRSFPASAFEESLDFAKSIFAFGSGQPVRRLTLFDHLKKSPESSASRQLITNAGKYGLVRGSYKADQLELTTEGLKAVDESLAAKEIARAKVKLAIEEIAPFKGLYDRLVGNRLPAKAALIDAMQELGVGKNVAEEAVDTFIVNLRFVGLLRTLSGAERIIPIEHLLESLPSSGFGNGTGQVEVRSGNQIITQERAAFETTCFYITPIGGDSSEQRKHSDLFLGSIIEPALEQFGLDVVRADRIEKPGVITRQVIEYILRSRIVIADLSFHNPNVFYELALRHATQLPIVQIIRTSESVPFDVLPMRTIKIDTTDIYSLVPKIELYRSEIATQVRQALDNAEGVDNPISAFFPALRAEPANDRGRPDSAKPAAA